MVMDNNTDIISLYLQDFTKGEK